MSGGRGEFVSLLKDGDGWSWVLFSLSDERTESGPVEFVGMGARWVSFFSGKNIETASYEVVGI